MENKKNNLPACCQPKGKKPSGLFAGIMYGVIPHAGCIAFILFSILGMTFAASLFRPLLAKAYFFYIMIALSLVFATISAMFYLRKQGGCCLETAGNHKRYLGILYGTTIAIGTILYMFIFPLVANVGASSNISADSTKLAIKVAIPCPGHAPLIIDEVQKINGVEGATFEFPNKFKISYNPAEASEEKILAAQIFAEYPATKI